VHRHLRVIVPSEPRRAFRGDRAVAQRRALGADGDDADVSGLRHPPRLLHRMDAPQTAIEGTPPATNDARLAVVAVRTIR
jgi:hypothetical protein